MSHTGQLYTAEYVRDTGEHMSRAATDDHDATAEAAAWIAHATRRLAGLSEADRNETDWADTSSALSQLRAVISQRISSLPRRGKPIRTATPGVRISHIALAKVLTEALAEPAAAVSAAIADVELTLEADVLTKVHVHLIGIGADPREHTYLQDGDALRADVARVLRTTVGENTAAVTAVWDDVTVPETPTG